jgi:aldehyde dehydrogenase (NAD+)
MEGETIVLGGKSDGERIEPTLLDNITFNSKVMQEEIFGPILPMITYESIEEVLNLFQGMHKPLAFYLFTNNKKIQKKVLNEAAFGGATINDTLMHFVNHHLGFGGVGYSGFGAYHGKKSFETFSHEKAVIKRGWFELPFRYHPLTPKKEKLLKKFLK